jgi:hypothetical protein
MFQGEKDAIQLMRYPLHPGRGFLILSKINGFERNV